MVTIHAPEAHYQSPIVRFGLRLFSLILIFGGAVGIVATIEKFQNARASATWPTTNGTVRESAIETRTEVNGKRTFTASVRYDYQVNGRFYDSRQISFADAGSSTRSSVDAIVARYPINAAVTVHDNPEDIQTAVLEPGVPPRMYLFMAIPPVMIVFGVVVWRFTKKKPAAINPVE